MGLKPERPVLFTNEDGGRGMATLLHRMVGDVYLLVRSAKPTPDHEFDEHFASISTLPGPKRVALIYFVDDGPFTGFDAARREKLASIGQLALPHAIVTESELARGFATAMRWRGTSARAFAREDLEEAFVFLAVPSPLRAEVRRAIAELSTQLGQTP